MSDALAIAGPGAAKPTPWLVKFGFVTLPIAHSAGFNVVTLLAFRFLTDNLAISAAAAGTLFALVKIYDGLLDPAVGAWSDRIHTAWGRRLPFIAAGGVLLALGLTLVFNPPAFGSTLALEVFLALALMIHATGYTALTIPGLAMLVEASRNYHERTGLMAWRVFGNSIGVVLGSTLPALLLKRWGSEHGHGSMALVVAGIILVATLVTLWSLSSAPRTEATAEERARRYRLRDQLALAWGNRPFRLLATAHIFVLAGTAVTSAAGAYFTRYVLLLPDSYLGTYYLVATIGSVATMPLWVWLSRRFGKKASYMGALAAFGLLHLLWLTARPGEAIAVLGLRAVLIGIASGGMILSSYSMMSDAVRFDFIKSGLRREGAFAGFTTLLDKLSAALGIALMGVFLQAMGYVATSGGGHANQPASAITGIMLCLTVVPMAAMMAAVLVVARYDLDEAALAEPLPA